MVKTIYADVLFLINFIINYLLLFATASILTLPFSRFRFSLSSALGAFYSLCFLLPLSEVFTSLFMKLLFALLMVFLAFGRQGILRAYITFITTSALFAGFSLLAALIAPRAISVPEHGFLYINLSFKTLFIASICAYIALKIIFTRRGDADKKICKVTVRNGGSSATFQALVDTGNSLRSPRTNGRVLISDYSSLRAVLPQKAAEILDECPKSFLPLSLDKLSDFSCFELIPYKTVGVSFSFLLAFSPDEIYLENKLLKNAVCAIADAAVSDGSGYNAII